MCALKLIAEAEAAIMTHWGGLGMDFEGMRDLIFVFS